MKKIYLYLIFLVFGLTSCVETIEIETDSSEPMIVIYGNITDELEKQMVKLSSSSPYFEDPTNKALSNAKVELSTSEGDKFEMFEDPKNKGHYYTTAPFAGKPGVTYSLKVAVDFDGDGEINQYHASATMLPSPPCDSIQIRDLEMGVHPQYFVWFYGANPETITYYMFKCQVNQSTATHRLKQYGITTNEQVKVPYISEIMVKYLADSVSIPTMDKDQLSTLIFVSPGDSVTLTVSSIEKQHFQFIQQAQKELAGDNPFFGGPASNIQHNILGGGVGYFSATANVRAKAVVPYKKN